MEKRFLGSLRKASAASLLRYIASAVSMMLARTTELSRSVTLVAPRANTSPAWFNAWTDTPITPSDGFRSTSTFSVALAPRITVLLATS
ncbi:hypothetical protein D3C72_1694560 [compost metagenome]